MTETQTTRRSPAERMIRLSVLAVFVGPAIMLYGIHLVQAPTTVAELEFAATVGVVGAFITFVGFGASFYVARKSRSGEDFSKTRKQMRFEYEPDPAEDDMAPGETEHADVEIHRVIEEKEGGQLKTVREDIQSDQEYSWPPVTGEHPRIKILEDCSEQRDR